MYSLVSNSAGVPFEFPPVRLDWLRSHNPITTSHDSAQATQVKYAWSLATTFTVTQFDILQLHPIQHEICTPNLCAELPRLLNKFLCNSELQDAPQITWDTYAKTLLMLWMCGVATQAFKSSAKFYLGNALITIVIVMRWTCRSAIKLSWHNSATVKYQEMQRLKYYSFDRLLNPMQCHLHSVAHDHRGFWEGMICHKLVPDAQLESAQYAIIMLARKASMTMGRIKVWIWIVIRVSNRVWNSKISILNSSTLPFTWQKRNQKPQSPTESNQPELSKIPTHTLGPHLQPSGRSGFLREAPRRSACSPSLKVISHPNHHLGKQRLTCTKRH